MPVPWDKQTVAANLGRVEIAYGRLFLREKLVDLSLGPPPAFSLQALAHEKQQDFSMRIQSQARGLLIGAFVACEGSKRGKEGG